MSRAYFTFFAACMLLDSRLFETFLNTKWCARVNQRSFGGKTDSLRHCSTSFSNNIEL